MDSPNVYSLTASVTAAGTVVSEWITGLEGMLALAASIQFAYGSGGSSCRVYLQTSFDSGATAQDVACAAFATAAATKQFNLSALTPVILPVASPTDGTMPDNTAQDGILGPRYRLKIISTGTYAGTQVTARLNAR
ncbi:hypothetical protein [Methylosinus sp. LW4]|uniref:hypothetical protein n=1 Tax=Methylosinus sp. LW4 TaxID=136993 RepID=UPI000382249A|nr:hypothetical protein [Methylosinus sp. LW4]